MSVLPRTAAPLVLLGVAAVLSACAPGQAQLARPAPALLPAESPLHSRTLSDADAWLRHHLALGDHGAALELLADGRSAPRDRLQRALQRALVLHHAGRWEASNERFEWAEREADRRYTRSLSRGLGSIALNDRALAWTPSPAELAMIPYYRMLNYLALGETEAAGVEARKANALGERLAADAAPCRDAGFLQYVAGLVHRAGNDRNAALVSLRQAERSMRACAATGAHEGGTGATGVGEAVALDLVHAARALGVGEVADSARARYALSDSLITATAHSGELVLLLEQGFVAHRAEAALHVPLLPADTRALEADDGGVAVAAAGIAARLLEDAGEHALWGSARDHDPAVQLAYAAQGAYVLRFAWPVARREPNRPAALRVWIDSVAVQTVPLASISAGVEHDLAAGRRAMLTRLVARGLLRFAAAQKLEAEAEEEGGEVLGFVAGRLANLAGNQLERADTRSWSLLPDDIALVRARVAPGEHEVRVEVLGASGAVVAVHELGRVQVQAGRPRILSRRLLDFGDLGPPAVQRTTEPAGAAAARVH